MDHCPAPPALMTWHGATRFCSACGTVHLSLAQEDGSVLRMRLTRETVQMLHAVLGDLLEQPWPVQPGLRCGPCHTHFSKSSGSSQDPGLSPAPGQYVAPQAKSSSAN